MISSSEKKNLSQADSLVSDLHITALGYETRCFSLLRQSASRENETLFLQFPSSDQFSYLENLSFARSLGRSTFIEYPSPNFLENLRNKISDEKYDNISVDISAMNRSMISAVFSSLAQRKEGSSLRIYYVPARFSNPSLDLSDVISAGPVLPEFSAFDDESDLASAIIMGLGFEYGAGLGLVNLIEPKNAICLYAQGHDTRFENAVHRANLGFKFPGTNATAVGYDLYDPAGTYRYLSNTVRNLLTQYRVSLIPMGPKLLSSLFALLTIEFLGHVTLWRVVRNAVPSNSFDDGHYICYSVDWKAMSSKKLIFSEVFEAAY